jgi:hypothetical protein
MLILCYNGPNRRDQAYDLNGAKLFYVYETPNLSGFFDDASVQA